MKNSTKIIGGAIALLTGLLQIPVVQAGIAAFLAAHPSVSSLLVGIGGLLALVHQPK